MGSEVVVDHLSAAGEEGEGDRKALGFLTETLTETILMRATKTWEKAKMWTSLDRVKAPRASSHDLAAHRQGRGYLEEGDLACTDVEVQASFQEEADPVREGEGVPGKVQTKAHSTETKEMHPILGKMTLQRARAAKRQVPTSAAVAMATSSPHLSGEGGHPEAEEVPRDSTLPGVEG